MAGMTRLCTFLRMSLRCLGVLACASFAVLTCRKWADPQIGDFWDFCHIIGTTLMGAVAGAGGIYLEVKLGMTSFMKHFRNRIALCIFYFWMGCYVMSGEIVGKDVWKMVARITGVVAWVVSAGDLATSCNGGGVDDEDSAHLERSEKGNARQASSLGRA